MADALYQRIQRLATEFMRRLPSQFREHVKPGVALSVSETAPPGQRLPSGKKHEERGSITINQLRVIASTSATDEEGVQRIYDLVMHGKDTTKQHERPMVSVDEIDRIVKERVQALLEAAAAGKQQAAKAVEHAATAVKETAPEESDVALWTERAEKYGLTKPVMGKRDPSRIDGRWLAYARKTIATKDAQATAT